MPSILSYITNPCRGIHPEPYDPLMSSEETLGSIVAELDELKYVDMRTTQSCLERSKDWRREICKCVAVLGDVPWGCLGTCVHKYLLK